MTKILSCVLWPTVITECSQLAALGKEHLWSLESDTKNQRLKMSNHVFQKHKNFPKILKYS